MKASVLTFLALLLLTGAIVTGCQGRLSEAELNKLQLKRDDSIKQAGIMEFKNKEAREAEQKALYEKREDDRQTLENLEARLNAELEGEKYKLETARSFQLMRSSSQKAVDIRNASMSVNMVERRIEYVQEQILKLNQGKAYKVPGRDKI